MLDRVMWQRDSVVDALAWFNSPQPEAMEPFRGKAYRVVRQFILETANPCVTGRTNGESE